MRAYKNNQGFTLIEVLVAALVLGVGLLGILAMQARSMQYTQQAYLYSQATTLAYDIADRMRANKDQLTSYQVEFDQNITGTSSDKCITAACTPAEFVKWDLANWKSELAAALPSGDGEIVLDGDQYLISVRFDDSRGEEDPIEISVTVQI